MHPKFEVESLITFNPTNYLHVRGKDLNKSRLFSSFLYFFFSFLSNWCCRNGIISVQWKILDELFLEILFFFSSLSKKSMAEFVRAAFCVSPECEFIRCNFEENFIVLGCWKKRLGAIFHSKS